MEDFSVWVLALLMLAVFFCVIAVAIFFVFTGEWIGYSMLLRAFVGSLIVSVIIAISAENDIND